MNPTAKMWLDRTQAICVLLSKNLGWLKHLKFLTWPFIAFILVFRSGAEDEDPLIGVIASFIVLAVQYTFWYGVMHITPLPMYKLEERLESKCYYQVANKMLKKSELLNYITISDHIQIVKICGESSSTAQQKVLQKYSTIHTQ